MSKKDWKVSVFSHRTAITACLAIISYTLASWIPIYAYARGCFLLGIGSLFLGMGIRVLTIGFGKPKTSGRGRKLKAEELNTTGPYAWIRNPLYLGNILAALGLATMTGNITFAVLLGISLGLLYKLVSLAEEDFLEGKFGEEYTIYKSQVPAFLPLFRANSYKDLPWGRFNLKRVVRREQDTIFILLVLAQLISTHRGYLSPLSGTGGILLLTIPWTLLKLNRKKGPWKTWKRREGPLPKGGLFQPEPALLPYIMAFVLGLATGSFLFLVKSDPFLMLLGKWL